MKNKLIIIVTMSLWDEPHRGRHHYANLLADNNTIIWVNRHYIWGERKKRKKGLEHIARGLYVLHSGLTALPGRVDNRLNINNRLRLRLLLTTLKKNGFNQKPDIIWIYDYKAINIAEFFKSKLNSKIIYFCNDYFGEFAFSRYESKLCSKVDFVFCTAPKLRDRLIKFNQDCIFLPHGIWQYKRIIKFKKKNKPETVGYIGTLRNAIDVDFFYKILDQTDMRIIIGGPIIECGTEKRDKFLRLFQDSRVSYLGNVKRNNMINIFETIDICLLPYFNKLEAEYMFALKYFDYLNAGKPIVATPYFEWPEPYSKFVSVYDGGYPLSDFLCLVYSDWTKQLYDAAIHLAAKSTWAHRAEQISKIIDNQQSSVPSLHS